MWGRAQEAVDLINRARARGLDVTADCYPYEAWHSNIEVIVANKEYDDPASVEKSIADLGGPSKITITGCEKHPDYVGKNLEEIAKTQGITAVDLYIQIVKDGGADIIGHSMTEKDVAVFYKQPWVMVGSDGGIDVAHPRGAGTFPKVLGRYVREKHWFTLPEGGAEDDVAPRQAAEARGSRRHPQGHEGRSRPLRPEDGDRPLDLREAARARGGDPDGLRQRRGGLAGRQDDGREARPRAGRPRSRPPLPRRRRSDSDAPSPVRPARRPPGRRPVRLERKLASRVFAGSRAARAAGHLVIVGGGPIPDAILRRFFELAGGAGKARIVVFPMASEDPEAGIELTKEFQGLGAAAERIVLDRAAATEDAARRLDGVTGIWFGGGDQSRLTAALQGTPVERAIHERYRAGAVVGGTSAGAAVMSTPMITGDEKHPGGSRPPKDPNDSSAAFMTIARDNIVTKEGFALLPGAIVDQHFVRRRRLNRLISVVLEHPELVGVGIDESTALEVGPDGRWRVLGESAAVVFDARKAAVTPAGAPTLGATGRADAGPAGRQLLRSLDRKSRSCRRCRERREGAPLTLPLSPLRGRGETGAIPRTLFQLGR